MVTLALAGDTMLGRGVADRLGDVRAGDLFSDEVVAAAATADLFVLNLECCISERGRRWPDPRKPFFFRAPPAAVDALRHLGVDAVTLANNHALDYGEAALLDTLDLLRNVGIATVGAGIDLASARRPVVIEADGFRLGIVGLSDHPEDFAADRGGPGIAYADLRSGVPGWVAGTIDELATETDAVLVTPHWGPNMTVRPVRRVRRAAARLAETRAALVAGHSAHVFHGVDLGDGLPVLYDLGDLIDDYAVDPGLRNDLGLLWFVDLDGDGRVVRISALPLRLDFCHTRVATSADRRWIEQRLSDACAEFGTELEVEDQMLVVQVPPVRGEGPRLG
jgi:poly-gamma-glutamate capsule biosynthesis protein CapA/YwtB (metallophosphatase superfamily)